MKLHSFTNEIIDIGTENGLGWHEGASMFLANVRSAALPEEERKHFYHGADKVDYAALIPHLDDLNASAARFVEDYRANQTEIIRLRKEGKADEITALMEAAGDDGQ